MSAPDPMARSTTTLIGYECPDVAEMRRIWSAVASAVAGCMLLQLLGRIDRLLFPDNWSSLDHLDPGVTL